MRRSLILVAILTLQPLAHAGSDNIEAQKDLAGARATATMLAHDFPDNPDLRKFLAGPAAPEQQITSK